MKLKEKLAHAAAKKEFPDAVPGIKHSDMFYREYVKGYLEGFEAAKAIAIDVAEDHQDMEQIGEYEIDVIEH